MTKKSLVYRRCEQFTRDIWELGWTKNIPVNELRDLIEEKLGGDPRTLHLYIKRLVKFGFLESKGGRIFDVNHPSIISIVKGQKQLQFIEKVKANE